MDRKFGHYKGLDDSSHCTNGIATALPGADGDAFDHHHGGVVIQADAGGCVSGFVATDGGVDYAVAGPRGGRSGAIDDFTVGIGDERRTAVESDAVDFVVWALGRDFDV